MVRTMVILSQIACIGVDLVNRASRDGSSLLEFEDVNPTPSVDDHVRSPPALEVQFVLEGKAPIKGVLTSYREVSQRRPNQALLFVPGSQMRSARVQSQQC